MASRTKQEKKYLTQQEVADIFRVRPSTVKNWRDRGLLAYFRAPGSTRVLYPVDAIEEFEKQSTTQQREVIQRRSNRENTRERPDVSNRTAKEWRI